MTFRSLRTKLAVIYAMLFGLVLAGVSAAAFVSVQNTARTQVREEMTATAAVFERLWSMRERQLGDAADILSRDFGFRAAVATQDAPTVESALANLQERLHVDVAFVLDLDGQVSGSVAATAEAEGLAERLATHDETNGVLMLDGSAYHAVARPVRAPTHIGWVVFAVRLSEGQLSELAGLSAIPIVARLESADAASPAGEVRRDQAQGALVSTIALSGLAGGDAPSLVLEYSLADAMARYRTMMLSILGLGAAGLVLLVAGTWVLARNLTQPLQALAQAADGLARGETMSVAVRGRDEIARLAEGFNLMGRQIAAREERITHMALHDGETGLANLQALEQAIGPVAERAGDGAVHAVVVTIERFIHIRGAIGYALAARTVAEVARRIDPLVPGATTGRVSTDRVGAVFAAEDDAAALALAARLADALSEPVVVGDGPVDVQVTVGLASLADMTLTGLTLLECAGVASDQARATGRRSSRFDRAAYGDPTLNVSLMSRLVAGLDGGDLFLAYQPKYDFRRQAICGVEALLRWKDRERGFIGPDAFIPLAEETGQILPLTEWVVDRTLADQVRMAAAGMSFPVAINLSGRLVSDRDFIARLIRRLDGHDGEVAFEITETAVIENPQAAIANMQALRDAGFDIAIDDYGAGLSSLSYLKAIPATELKIDKAFVLELGAGTRDALLVKSTIDLAHSLGLTVTAEGVETAEGQALLAAMGADRGQGYHIARPMPLEALIEQYSQDAGRPNRAAG